MSDRTFGLAWCVILGVFGLLPLWRGEPPQLHLLALAALMGLIALFAARLLAIPNRLWSRFGRFMHRVTSNLMLTLLYFLFLTPGAWLLRLLGRKQLHIDFDRKARTYWIDRTHDGTDFTLPY